PPPISFFCFQCSVRFSLYPAAQSTPFTFPSSFCCTILRYSLVLGSCCSRYPIDKLFLFFLQASIMSWHSWAVMAIGFSHHTCFPALAPRITYSLCIEGGNTTYTISISGLLAMLSKLS